MKTTSPPARSASELLGTPASKGRRGCLPLAAFLLLAFAAQSQAVTTLVSNPYPYYRPLGQPPGLTYGIAGMYRIDPTSSPDPFQAATIAGTNLNVDNAFPGGIGVLSPDTGHTGIGLYTGAAPTQSTGLFIQFDQLVLSDGLSVSLGNFGVNSLTGGFDPGRVAPMLSIYGTGATLLGTFDAQAMLDANAMTLLTSSNPLDASYNPFFQVDTWKLDLDALIGPSAQVKGFALGADLDNGKGLATARNSNPYYLISVEACACAPVPEPGSALLVLSAALGATIIRRRRL